MIQEPPKPHIYTAAELQQIKLSLARDDPEYRYEHHYWIKDKAGKIRPMRDPETKQGGLKLAQRKTLPVLA